MKTEVVPSRQVEQGVKAVSKAVALLRKGKTVALPTETVYGLAANALNPIAVARIFEAKERPRFDPLIVHLPSRDWLERVAKIDNESRDLLAGTADARLRSRIDCAGNRNRRSRHSRRSNQPA